MAHPSVAVAAVSARMRQGSVERRPPHPRRAARRRAPRRRRPRRQRPYCFLSRAAVRGRALGRARGGPSCREGMSARHGAVRRAANGRCTWRGQGWRWGWGRARGRGWDGVEHAVYIRIPKTWQPGSNPCTRGCNPSGCSPVYSSLQPAPFVEDMAAWQAPHRLASREGLQAQATLVAAALAAAAAAALAATAAFAAAAATGAAGPLLCGKRAEQTHPQALQLASCHKVGR